MIKLGFFLKGPVKRQPTGLVEGRQGVGGVLRLQVRDAQRVGRVLRRGVFAAGHGLELGDGRGVVTGFKQRLAIPEFNGRRGLTALYGHVAFIQRHRFGVLPLPVIHLGGKQGHLAERIAPLPQQRFGVGHQFVVPLLLVEGLRDPVGNVVLVARIGPGPLKISHGLGKVVVAVIDDTGVIRRTRRDGDVGGLFQVVQQRQRPFQILGIIIGQGQFVFQVGLLRCTALLVKGRSAGRRYAGRFLQKPNGPVVVFLIIIVGTQVAVQLPGFGVFAVVLHEAVDQHLRARLVAVQTRQGDVVFGRYRVLVGRRRTRGTAPVVGQCPAFEVLAKFVPGSRVVIFTEQLQPVPQMDVRLGKTEGSLRPGRPGQQEKSGNY